MRGRRFSVRTRNADHMQFSCRKPIIKTGGKGIEQMEDVFDRTDHVRHHEPIITKDCLY